VDLFVLIGELPFFTSNAKMKTQQPGSEAREAV
jgi:hypothetical protein